MLFFYILPEATGNFCVISLQRNYFVPFKNCQSPFLLSDDYKEYSIKSLERIRREESQACIARGSSTKLPREWKYFLKNDENFKKAIYSVSPNEWQKDTYAQLLTYLLT